MKVNKPINLFLPQKMIVDLDNYLVKNEPKFKADTMRFYYIIHYLTMMQNRTKRKDYYYLNKKEIDKIISCKSDKYIRILKKGGFIEHDQCIPGLKSCHFRLSPKYHSQVGKIELQPDSVMYKNLIRRNNQKKAHYNRLEPHLREMHREFAKLEIDYESALNWIQNNTDHSKHYHYLTALEQLHDKRFRYFNRNKTNNRIDTNVTNLKSKLRKFFIGDFVSIDLKNSQPFLIGALLHHLHHKGTLCWLFSEVELVKTFGIKVVKQALLIHQNQKKANLVDLSLFIDSVTKGMLYDDMVIQYEGKMDRDEVKEMIMKVLYSRNVIHNGFKKSIPYKTEKEEFAKIYPSVYDFLVPLKSKDHRNLPIYFQKVESYLFIDCIAKELVKNGIVPITIHDSVLIQRKDTATALSIMQSVCEREIGIIPEFKIDDI
ncbi:MAG: hypothetical protein ACXAC2_07315 [Candidatus Kariarchaeaceae archaeon]|jgi:hypothetical protein